MLHWLVATALLSQAPSPEADKRKVLITRIRAEPQIAPLAESLVAVVAKELSRLGPFKATTLAEIQEMMSLEERKQLLGCDEASCFAEVGGALGAELAVRGTLSQLSGGYLLNLQLIDVQRAQVKERVTRRATDEAELLEVTATGCRALMREELSESAGKLLLRVSEESSSVFVDDRLVGSSPMPLLELGGGVHNVRVSREGFVDWKRDVEIIKDDVTSVDVMLLPSAEFIRAYEERAALHRTLGWSGVGGGALLGLGAVAAYVAAITLATSRDRAIAEYGQMRSQWSLPQRQERWDAISRQNGTITTLDWSAAGGALVSGILSSVGSYFLFSGDDPDRYLQLKTAGTIDGGVDQPQSSLRRTW